MLYGELASGSQGVKHPELCNKGVCKHDMKACNIDTESWEVIAENRTLWKKQDSYDLKWGACAMHDIAEDKRAMMKASHQTKKLLPQNHKALCLHVPGLRQIVQIEDWSLQPYKRMYLNRLYRRYSIVCKTEGCQQQWCTMLQYIYKYTYILNNKLFYAICWNLHLFSLLR